MTETTSYPEILQEYTQKVQALFTSPGEDAGERGFRGPTTYTDLVAQVEEIAPLSGQLTEAAAGELSLVLPGHRQVYGTALMAKSLADLQISAVLLEAAVDQRDDQPFQQGVATERRSNTQGLIKDLIKWLQVDIRLDEINAPPDSERSRRALPNLPKSRTILRDSVEDGIDLITSRAGRIAQLVIFDLVPVDPVKLLGLPCILNAGLAQALESVQPGKRILELFQIFVIRSIESLLSLVGTQVIESFTNQVLEWINPVKDGVIFAPILKGFYGMAKSESELFQMISNSQRNARNFQQAAQDIESLVKEHYHQVQLGAKINSGLGVLGTISSALVLPVGTSLLTLGKVVLGAYLIIASGDYLDAPKLSLLNRVPGISTIVGARLAVPLKGESP